MTAHLTDIEIQQRIRRYTRLLVALCVHIFFSLVIFHIYLEFESEENYARLTASFALVGMAATWIMYSMIRNFSTNKAFIRFTFVTFFISFWLGIIAVNPINPIPFSSPLYFWMALLNQLGSFTAFVIILVLMIHDIFTETHTIGYRLLGAACIYLNIGVVFSFIYGAINVVLPNAMGLGIPAEFTSYMHCVNYSYYILAGIDHPYLVSGVIGSVAVIQSLFANLYIVLLIGRILIK